jgi:hypothetical protein
MSMTETFKYRAFFSYSHADTDVAMRVHKRLDGSHIDKELVSRVTATIPIPTASRVARKVERVRNSELTRIEITS